ncbi:MAG: right-handed parallel beta-helix repeat-containing protein, partial [Sphingobacteriales bacterium]
TKGLSNCDNNIIDSNTITGGYYAIDMNSYAGNFGFSYTPMNNNVVTNNHITGFTNGAINVIWNNNALIQGNDIEGETVQSSYGIHLDEKNTNIRINGNRIHNISSQTGAANANFEAISITNCLADAANGNQVTNNLIYDVRNQNDQDGISFTGSSWINVYHNSIILDGPAAGSGVVTTGFKLQSANSNINFKNNIVTVHRPGTGTGYGIYALTAPGAFVSDYNDITVTTPNRFGRWVGTSYPLLADWQTGTTQDAHSASHDPIFTDPATGNYKPTNAAMDNLGIYVAVNFDILGQPRNNIHPDAGAYEFLTPPCGTPVIAGSAIGAPPIPLCSGLTRTLNLAGNSFGNGQTYRWQSAPTLTGPYTNIGNSNIIP